MIYTMFDLHQMMLCPKKTMFDLRARSPQQYGATMYGSGPGCFVCVSLKFSRRQYSCKVSAHLLFVSPPAVAHLQDMAFVLHHSQMARSVNPYATTLYYAKFLEDMSKVDEAGETSDIPGCALCCYFLDLTVLPLPPVSIHCVANVPHYNLP
jgi:hypothetical protein